MSKVDKALQEAKQIHALQRYPYQLDNLKPIDFVIEGYFRNGVNLFAGTAGVGKTSILVPLASEVTHFGDPHSVLRPKKQRRVIYMSEDCEQVERTLYGMAKKSGFYLPKDFLDMFILIESKRIGVHDLCQQIITLSDQHMITQIVGNRSIDNAPLVVLDTASANIDMDNESDNSEASGVVAVVKETHIKTGSPIWISGHVSKTLKRGDARDLSFRGASAWEADVHQVNYVTEDERFPNSRFITLGKHRFESKGNEIECESHRDQEDVEDGLGGYQTVSYRFSTFKPSSTYERESLKAEKAIKESQMKEAELRETIYEFIKDQNLNSLFVNRQKIRDSVTGKYDLKNKLINQLIDSKMIEEIEIPKKERTNSNQKFKLVLSGTSVQKVEDF
jgi:hypothetical protein